MKLISILKLGKLVSAEYVLIRSQNAGRRRRKTRLTSAIEYTFLDDRKAVKTETHYQSTVKKSYNTFKTLRRNNGKLLTNVNIAWV